jgi:type IV pilus assembly protein PilO
VSDQLEAIFSMSSQKKAIIAALVVAAVVGLFYFLVYSPVGEQVAELDKKINGGSKKSEKQKSLRYQVTEKRKIANNLPAFRKEVKRLNIELKKALLELPDKREIDRLLAKISDKATDTGLEIGSFKPQGEKKKEFHAEQPVEISLNGSYHQLATFFDEVGHMQRIVNLDNFHINQPVEVDNGISVSTTVVATAFRFLDESERPKLDEKGKGRRRRRKN